MGMWEPFTERARSSVVLAQEEAQRLGNDFIGTEHVLLGILGVRESIAAGVMSSFGVDVEKARLAVRAIAGECEPSAVQQMAFTPNAKHAIELAFNEARMFNHNYVGSEHLLLGIMIEPECTGARALASLGVDFAAVRSAITAAISAEPQSSTADAAPQRPGAGSMWEPFSEHARRIIVAAQEEAQHQKENYIDTGHMLAGILREADSLAAKTLVSQGLSLAAVREALAATRREKPPQDMVFTPGAKRVIDLAFEYARELKDSYIGAEHLALGVIRDDAETGGMLARLGFDPADLSRALRQAVAEARKQRGTEPDA
jgi:ATP-dependent Clp protease ATP-binding subunit ClpA